MNLKALLPTVIGVLVALVAYDMFVKKMIPGASYEEEYDYDEE